MEETLSRRIVIKSRQWKVFRLTKKKNLPVNVNFKLIKTEKYLNLSLIFFLPFKIVIHLVHASQETSNE